MTWERPAFYVTLAALVVVLGIMLTRGGVVKPTRTLHSEAELKAFLDEPGSGSALYTPPGAEEPIELERNGSSVIIKQTMPKERLLGNRNRGQATACKSNLKNIGTALEMWSTDNHGRYPSSLAELTPNYLKTIPSCPAAGRDTYSSGFVSHASPDSYLVICEGSNHTDVGYSANYPQYTSTEGLKEK